MRLIKLLVVLILAGLIGLVGYAYLGDMEPQRQEVRSPVGDGAAGD
ncbi:hypothetical protein PAF17_11175 [Paracoccus sp. Z330]|uniref:Uncharacterized protein n=1 Tax=Paracoccus onchidii TaxID=3017813 RepID=A0ABT4ZFC9_9RHOB|nr:hypothetical protein [Paracoccus onchidii]MDB6178063.1 hypothetical protein [Paracoccus onchidii]